MSDLERRIIRLEDRHRVVSPCDAAADARHQRRMTGLAAFIGAAWPEHTQSLAHHAAQIFGLPDSRAMQAYLGGQSIEDIQTLPRAITD